MHVGKWLSGQMGGFLGLGIGGAIGCIIGFVAVGRASCKKGAFSFSLAETFGHALALLVAGGGGALGVYVIGGAVGGWVGAIVGFAAWHLPWYFLRRKHGKGLQ